MSRPPWSDFCRIAPFAHQVVGTDKLLTQPVVALFDEVGAGKSKQVIDAICATYTAGLIDTVIVLAPASARSVWADPDPVLGEFAKHRWDSVPAHVQEYTSRAKWRPHPPIFSGLYVVVTNYEFLRRAERLDPLIAFAKARRTWLVCDESWMIKNPRAQQTKAVRKLRAACVRATVLNGTPGDPGEQFAQFAVLDPAILGHRNFYTFRAEYATMGGYLGKQILSWRNLDRFAALTAPYVLRRRTHECVDLPPTRTTQITVALTPETWAHYVAMRDDLLTWLSQTELVTAAQAGVRVLRLAQITAGFLGGIEQTDSQGVLDLADDGLPARPATMRAIGREKLDAVLTWLQDWRATAAPPHQSVLWGRFRAEIERTAHALADVFPGDPVHLLYGGQTPEAREAAKRALAPGGDARTSYVVGSPQAGGAGLNLAGANVAIYLTNSFSLKDRLQSEGRVDRPGQTRPVLYVDVLATGPAGQKTLDHHVVAALRKKRDLSDLTADGWRAILEAD